LTEVSASRPDRSVSCLAPGATLAGKYRLVSKLGTGGMCIIYEAEHVHLHQPVAVKVLKPELAEDEDCVARFEREARAAAALKNAHVAHVFDVDWLPTGQPYITMELLLGNDLGKELTKVGRVPLEVAVDYVRQACSGIAEAHAAGIVHRDVKPENLFLVNLGELTDRRMVKLLDFGIAKTITDEARKLTAPDAVFGTVDYMSPEQIRSASTVDHRSDIWSLGVILYELVTGRTPYAGDARSVIAQIVSDPIRPPSAYIPDLPPSFVSVVMKALAKDPAQRYQSATELREALEPFVDLEPITNVVAKLPPTPRIPSYRPPPVGSERRVARTDSSWETAPPQKKSRTLVVAAAAALALVAFGSSFAAFRHPEWLGRHAAEPPPTPVPVTTTAPDPPAPVSATPPPPTQPVAANDPPAPSAASSAKSRRRHPRIPRAGATGTTTPAGSAWLPDRL
jgi:serine/threonine-protein kinase